MLLHPLDKSVTGEHADDAAFSSTKRTISPTGPPTARNESDIF